MLYFWVMSELGKTCAAEIILEKPSKGLWLKLLRNEWHSQKLVQNLDYSKTKEDLEIVAFVNMSFPHWKFYNYFFCFFYLGEFCLRQTRLSAASPRYAVGFPLQSFSQFSPKISSLILTGLNRRASPARIWMSPLQLMFWKKIDRNEGLC